MKCPHCGADIKYPLSPTPFRAKLIELADGTRSAVQLAKLTGKTPEVVASTILIMKKQGYSVRLKRCPPKRSEEMLDAILLKHRRGAKLKNLAEELGISTTRVSQIVERQWRKKKKSWQDRDKDYFLK